MSIFLLGIKCTDENKSEEKQQINIPAPPSQVSAPQAKHYDFDFKQTWKIHDMNRPNPQVIDPGRQSTQDDPGTPPSDAVILFDGTDLSKWCALDGSPTQWILGDGFMECVEGSGYIRTKQSFGDCQLHIEFATPVPPEGKSQGRGNSGVFLMGEYEVQVLDSYENRTYADGQAAAVYGQYPPMVNASRPPGEWQSYDIVFRRPRFTGTGELQKPARMTVFHNGILVQENVEILGPTAWMQRAPYEPHADKLPLSLQDHGNPVRYRNIWIRELPDPDQIGKPSPEYILTHEVLDKYVGQYQSGPNSIIRVTRSENNLVVRLGSVPPIRFFAKSETRFFSKIVDLEIEFETDSEGNATQLTYFQGGGKTTAEKIAGKNQ
jgi:hypothetical protein